MLLSIYGDYGEEICWVTAVVYVRPGQQINQGGVIHCMPSRCYVMY